MLVVCVFTSSDHLAKPLNQSAIFIFESMHLRGLANIYSSLLC